MRLNVISRLNEVNAVIGLEHLAKALLPAIDDLAENDEWRTRLAIIEYIPTVSSQLVCVPVAALTFLVLHSHANGCSLSFRP